MSSRKKNHNGLLEMEQRFADEYLVDFNGRQAAIRAGYSQKTATSKASQLLTKVNIQAYLQKKMQKVAAKLDISIERTLLEIARVAYANPKNYFNEDGTFKSIHELSDDAAAVISSTEIEEEYGRSVVKGLVASDQDAENEDDAPERVGRQVKIKFWDKMKGLEMLAKHLKIYSDAPTGPVINLNTKTVTFK